MEAVLCPFIDTCLFDNDGRSLLTDSLISWLVEIVYVSLVVREEEQGELERYRFYHSSVGCI